MLLRSLTKHVKDQNWFAVFLDFFIVVAGILIAFQITNWNQGRTDNKRVERHLENIVGDLRLDIITIEEVIKTGEWRHSAIHTVLKRAGKPLPTEFETPRGEIIEMRDFPAFESKLPSTANSALIWTETLEVNRSGYESLINSGDLQLIKNNDLGLKIQAYYARINDSEGWDENQDEIRDSIRSSQFRLGSRFGHTSLEELIELVRNDQKFAAELTTLSIYDTFQADRMRSVAAQAKALITVIEETR